MKNLYEKLQLQHHHAEWKLFQKIQESAFVLDRPF